MSHFKDDLLSDNSKANDLKRIILEVMNEKKPQYVRQLTKMLKEKLDLEEEEIIESVLKLQAEGVIKLENQALQSQTLVTYLKTGEAIWYWVTIAAGLITAALVFTIAESFYPWIYARNLFGVIFVLFLPGYAFTKALFQDNIFNGSSKGDLEKIEQIALSVGMSIALVSIVGLLLYYSPWGLDLTAIVFSLLVLTFVFSTVAVVREYKAKKNRLGQANYALVSNY
jgi:uncharacterized membrane protein